MLCSEHRPGQSTTLDARFMQAGGYRVIEVNATISRTGAAVMRLVGEATQSQRVSTAAIDDRGVAPALALAPPPAGAAADVNAHGKDSRPAGKGRGSKAVPAGNATERAQPKLAAIFGEWQIYSLAAGRNKESRLLLSLIVPLATN